MPLPCSPIPPPKITTALSHRTHRANHAAHRIWHHVVHRSIPHAAVHTIKAARTACNALPQWLLHAVVALPVVLSLHAATPGQNAPSGRQPPLSAVPDADPSASDPVAIPTTSVVPPNDPGSSIISFAPTVASPPPDPAAVLAPRIVKSPGGSPDGSVSPHTQSGGRPGDPPPMAIGATSSDLPSAVIGATSSGLPSTVIGATSSGLPSTVIGATGSGLPSTVIGATGSGLPSTVIGATGSDLPQPIPEPPAWLVLALPAAALVLAKRQRPIAMYRSK